MRKRCIQLGEVRIVPFVGDVVKISHNDFIFFHDENDLATKPLTGTAERDLDLGV